MLEVALIETGIGILEKLTGLLKLSRTNKQEQFEKLATPIFEDMKVIHRNYLHMFIKAKRTLETSHDISKISQMLEEDRIELSAIRSSTVAISYALSRKSHLKKFKAFLVSISDYFDAYSHNQNNIDKKVEGGTAATSFLERVNATDQIKTKKQQVVNEILQELGAIIINLEDKWRKVSNNYAELMGDNI